MRHYLAWQSILDDRERLDLPPHQVRQAENRKQESESAVRGRIGETYQWLLAPAQSSPTDTLKWERIRLTAQGALAERASKRMRSGELLVTNLAGTLLRIHMDKIPLWRGNHVSIGQLIEDFSRYSYLPRLRDPAVLLECRRQRAFASHVGAGHLRLRRELQRRLRAGIVGCELGRRFP